MACTHCGTKKVRCDAPLGIGTTCRECSKANRVCEWPLALEQELTTSGHGSRSSGTRSCATCKTKKIRCNHPPKGTNGPCGNCALNGLPCSLIRVAQRTHPVQPVVGPSNQGLATGSSYHAPQHEFSSDADAIARPPTLSIDISMMDRDDSGSSVTPSSGPSSPRSFWEIVMNQEYSTQY